MFSTYCKKVLRNLLVDYMRTQTTKREREISIFDFNIENSLAVEDDYLIEEIEFDGEVIEGAVRGDVTAINMIVNHYQRYIYKLATCKMIDEKGNERYAIDPYLVSLLENHLIKCILKFKLE